MKSQDKNTRCFYCGETANATWHGCGENVNVCRQCAIDHLPRLIADAIFLPNRQRGKSSGAAHHAQKQLTEIERNFWTAIACRVDSEAADWESLVRRCEKFNSHCEED